MKFCLCPYLTSKVTQSSSEHVDAAPALISIARIGAISLHNDQVQIGRIKKTSEVNDIVIRNPTERWADWKLMQSMMDDRATDFYILQICWELGQPQAVVNKATETKFLQGWRYDGRLLEYWYGRTGTFAEVGQWKSFELGKCGNKGKKIDFQNCQSTIVEFEDLEIAESIKWG